MKWVSATLLALLMIPSASSPAIGQQEMRRGGTPLSLPGRNEQSAYGSGRQSPGETSPVQMETGQQAIHQPVAGQGREHLSSEERRQLRRDINAAGRDIYRQRRAE